MRSLAFIALTAGLLWSSSASAEPVPWSDPDHGATEPPVSFRAEPGFTGKLDVGAAYRQIYSIPIFGADVMVALGGQTAKAGAWYWVGEVVIGETELGLFTKQGLVGFAWEVPYGPWRFGITHQGSYLGFKRATTGNHYGRVGVGNKLHVSYDLAQSDRMALYVGLRGGIDSYSEVLGGATAGLGVRLF